jgi:hypothetical protein
MVDSTVTAGPTGMLPSMAMVADRTADRTAEATADAGKPYNQDASRRPAARAAGRFLFT